ncbi:hypothetical protein RFN58_20595 [Streptomyces iakyrus]|uniref:hypothetical protein n=1 Tax=Streptomyces iakyrus TaxID=68219 RepID=UPI000527A47F|nr:hypothetical protein [Streptomyces iakyrus]
MNWGGGVPVPVSARASSHHARARSVWPSSNAIWARISGMYALESRTPYRSAAAVASSSNAAAAPRSPRR